MKIKNIFTYFAILVLGTGLVKAQLTGTENYVYSKTHLSKPGDSTYMQKPPVETVTYFDGLGRPKQNILVNGAGNGKDLVTAIKYDDFGRQVLDILPVPANTKSNGFHDTILDESTANTYYSGIGLGGNAYSEKKLELSPLDRIEHQYGPGDTWKSNSKKSEFFYETNGNEVKNYTATYDYATSTTSISLSGSPYPPSTLYRNRSTDEDGNQTREYKNGEGQTILVRKVISSGIAQGIAPTDPNSYADTYYVYNNYNQLAYVIPPLAVNAGNVSTTTLDNLCYQYIYDGKGRLVEKKLPGKGREFMVYDRADRLILTQDANLSATGKWLLTKYDIFGRVIYTGILPGGSRESMQSQIDLNHLIITETRNSTGFAKNGITVYYTNNYFVSLETVLSVNYYDTYPTGTPFPTQNKIFGEAILQNAYDTESKSVKSLPTASFVKNINDDRWTKNYTFYDKRGRTIGNHSTNHLGGSTVVHSRLDFAGAVYKSKTYNKRINAELPVVVEEKFEYDDQKKLVKHYHQVLGKTPEELLAENTYNELGQLTQKKVGNSLQTINYNYNIRGWMTGINLVNGALSTNKLFSYKINYENPTNPALKKFNGNISEINWWIAPSATSNRYDYSYDGLNRLKKADFKTVGATGTTDSRLFNEELTYDANGNITNLKRNGKTSASATIGTLVDNLNYSYVGNMVTNISDATSNPTGYNGTGQLITYDVNGNMKTFPDKGISQINYNFLNLPQSIVQNSNFTNYLYRADGTKVSKAFVLNGATIDTDYLDGFVYTSTYTQQLEAALLADDLPTREAVSAGQEESMQLERKVVAVPNNPPSVAAAKPSFFPTAEGFYDYDNYKYIYQYKDHLGNVRLSYSKNATTGLIAIEDTNDYYPFGLSFINGGASNYSPSTTYKNYKYNGKELQETGMYDYGARMYMPDIGRWGVLDGKGELYLSKSPYSYANNTPVNAIDPDGNIVIFINGMHTGEGGSSRYWTDYNSPVGRMQVAGGSWMTMYKRFDMAVMRQLNDYNAIYRDGALGGAMNTALYAVEKGINPFASSVSDYTNNLSPTNRRNWGYAQGQRDAKTIIDNLARDTTSGEIVETIKIISHSMGGAYAKGYVRALKQYISTLPKEQQSQIKISFEADFAPFQPTKQQAVDGVNTFQFSHSKDRVAGNKEMDGAYNQDTSSDKGQGHSIFDFFEQVKNLSEGNYKVVNGKIVTAN